MAKETRLPNPFGKFFPLCVSGGAGIHGFLNLVRVSAAPIAADGDPLFSFESKDCRANLHAEAAGDAFGVRVVQLLAWSSS
jgi:hypothetical protein